MKSGGWGPGDREARGSGGRGRITPGNLSRDVLPSSPNSDFNTDQDVPCSISIFKGWITVSYG